MGLFNNFFSKIFSKSKPKVEEKVQETEKIDICNNNINYPKVKDSKYEDIRKKIAEKITDPVVLWNKWEPKIHDKYEQVNRFERSLCIEDESFKINELQATFYGSEQHPYKTTLTTCTCQDFSKRFGHHYAGPCKHMYRLAIELSLIKVDTALKEKAEKEKIQELQYQEELKKYMLTDKQISYITSLVNITECYVSFCDWEHPTKSFEELFEKKIDSYQNKLDNLLEKIKTITDFEKIEAHIFKINDHLFTFKQFCYDKGHEGRDFYESSHQDDIEYAKDNIEDYLKYYYPDIALEKNQDKEYINRVKSIEKQVIEKLKTETSLGQASLINNDFFEYKSETQKAIDNLVKKGKIVRYKKGKYIIELAK